MALITLKHPPAPGDLFEPPAPDPNCAHHCDSAAVIRSLASFPPGTAAGLDGLRPDVLRELTSFSAREAGVSLSSDLARLMNVILLGGVPDFIRRSLFAATLTALTKNDGGLRPISVGTLYRRLATKAGLYPISSSLGETLDPIQLGFGVRGGCEAAAHAARWFYENMSTGDVMVQVDMANAFNTLRRDRFLTAIHARAPSIYPLLWQAYSQSTPLFFGPHELESATGVQQGDPAGPAIFAITLDEVTRDIGTPLNSWYLDDGLLGGPVDLVADALTALKPALLDLGLGVNARKCTATFPNSGGTNDVETITNVLPAVQVTEPGSFTHLGAPVAREAIASSLTKKSREFRLMCERLTHIEPHAALFLLTRCLGIPKLQYILRTSNFP